MLADGGHLDDTELLAGGGTAAGVEWCWSSVVELAVQLRRTGEVRHHDVCAALGIPEGDNGHHLSMIAAGSPPGSFTVAWPV